MWSAALTSTIRELVASVRRVFPLQRRLANAHAPRVPLAVNVATIWSAVLTSMALWFPSSAIRKLPFASFSAELGLTSWSAGVTLVPGYDQMMFLLLSTRMTRLLPWSVMRTVPRSL